MLNHLCYWPQILQHILGQTCTQASLCSEKKDWKWFQLLLVSISLSSHRLPPCSTTLQPPAADGRCDWTRQDSGRSARHAQRCSKAVWGHCAHGGGAAEPVDALERPDWSFKLLTTSSVLFWLFAVSTVACWCTDVYFLENKIQWMKTPVLFCIFVCFSCLLCTCWFTFLHLFKFWLLWRTFLKIILPCFPCLALMVNLFQTPSLDGTAAISAALCPCGSGAHRAVCVKYWAVRCLEILPD